MYEENFPYFLMSNNSCYDQNAFLGTYDFQIYNKLPKSCSELGMVNPPGDSAAKILITDFHIFARPKKRASLECRKPSCMPGVEPSPTRCVPNQTPGCAKPNPEVTPHIGGQMSMQFDILLSALV
jgi:hypothetical protein